MEVDKTHQNADWSYRPLSEDMLEYAIMDVEYLIPIYRTFSRKMDEENLWDQHKEETQTAILAPEIYAVCPERIVRRLKKDDLDYARHSDPFSHISLEAIIGPPDGVSSSSSSQAIDTAPDISGQSSEGVEEGPYEVSVSGIIERAIRDARKRRLDGAMGSDCGKKNGRKGKKKGGKNSLDELSIFLRLSCFADMRETAAMDIDIPRTWVLRDSALVELACWLPWDQAELSQCFEACRSKMIRTKKYKTLVLQMCRMLRGKGFGDPQY